MPDETGCAISESPVCAWIGGECTSCFVKNMKREEAEKVLADFEVTLSLLPADFDELQGEVCQFCRNGEGRRGGYALTDMAHAEPVSEKGMFFGFGKKVRRKVGSLMPLSISICRDCRRAMRFAEAIRWIVPLCVAAVATAAAVILRTGSDIVLAVLTLSLLAGYAAGRITSAAYVRAKSENIRFNPLEIPVIRDMKDAGWFMLDDRQRVVFSSKPHTKKISALSGGLNQTKGQC